MPSLRGFIGIGVREDDEGKREVVTQQAAYRGQKRKDPLAQEAKNGNLRLRGRQTPRHLTPLFKVRTFILSRPLRQIFLLSHISFCCILVS